MAPRGPRAPGRRDSRRRRWSRALLKTTGEDAAAQIHSRLFSAPKENSAWGRNERLSHAGLRDYQYSANDPIALKNLQSDVTEKKSDFAKDTLASQNTKMISSIVISQLIDEHKSEANGAASPAPSTVAQPHACPTRPPLANPGGVSVNSAFAFLPSRLEIQTPAEARGPETELPPKEKPCSGPPKGFASITITARRLGPPARTMVWGAARASLYTKCQAQDTLLEEPSALATGADPCRHKGPFTCTELSRNSSVMRLEFPEARARLCEGHECWVTKLDGRGHRFAPGATQPGKGPLVFSSCVHLRVSQQCPNSIYYLDRSLSVPIEPPQLAGPKVHRSVLSLNLSCSSHGLTAGGAGGTAMGGGPGSRDLQQELPRESQSLLGRRWKPAVRGPFLKQHPSLAQVHLGTGTCPWGGSPLLENPEFADAGTHQATVRNGKEGHAVHQSSLHASQLSIHIPGWSYAAVETKVFSGSSEKQREARVTVSAPPMEWKLLGHSLAAGLSSPSNDLSEPAEPRRQSFLEPGIPLPGFLCPLQDARASPQEDSGVRIGGASPRGDYTCCDLVVKIKECEQSEDSAMPEPEPVLPEPAPEEPETSAPPEACSEGQQAPASSLTLQEALEVRNPRFISRSRERLKKLEHMAQQRRAQRKENLAQKQALLPVRANKKQFTIPHPLSDNLFKPKERYISEKEMHLRSRRIYNNLPEVKKKKEEQKKRVILQSNRLRAEVFKKQLLDQLLQRNAV
ncbi:(E2-independent) E3 ubiquitin-conjugating enzyme FATS [Pteropus medius]|uniref:(E2-independent) E3 ubiquitin-conjugating enzyme FATS n=1 Tax=Pteropus vampyrus TaxID=132908 RepID=UPI00196AE210|nr:(E2-independent) E3 ubiquitin-conjugating enzyme FATS [Pteropus giganteus]